MLTLVTGTPGAGKSLYVIDHLQDETERPVYYHGIDDLKLPWYPLEDPKNWPEEVPDGAIVVLDEVQKYFGPRTPQQQCPPGVSALETHRHRGLDLWFITQHPNLLDFHARRLVGEHLHLRRSFGAPFATLYHGNEVMDPKDRGELAKAQKIQWRYPKKTFRLYKSAEVHTHKFRIPRKVFLFAPAIAAVAGGAWWAYTTLWGDNGMVASSPAASASAPAPAGERQYRPAQTARESARVDGRQARKGEAIDWHERMTPQVEGLPWTAPLYAKAAEPKSVPRIKACIASDDRCTCYTQQATRIDGLDDATCRKIVQRGYFDFMAEPQRERDSEVARRRYERRMAQYRRVHQIRQDIRRIRAGDDVDRVPAGRPGTARSANAGVTRENAERAEPPATQR